MDLTLPELSELLGSLFFQLNYNSLHTPGYVGTEHQKQLLDLYNVMSGLYVRLSYLQRANPSLVVVLEPYVNDQPVSNISRSSFSPEN